jgi:DNA-binding NtrC family response regulator
MRILHLTAPDSLEAIPAGLRLETVSDPDAAFSQLRQSDFGALLACFPLDGWTPGEVLAEAQRANPAVPVILRDSSGTMDEAVRLTKLGAYHYIGGDIAPLDLTSLLESAVEWRRSCGVFSLGQAVEDEPWSRFLVGCSRPMRNVMEIIRLVGPRKCTVLICGETGTGKELVARAIHQSSPRAHLPMVALNCSALPEHLLEAELFGHTKGAFTGATNQRIGRFEEAHRGTIFLDEVADMPLDLQAKLLRVLQEREFQRLGSSETVHVDVRVIAATNVDLADRVRQGKFREDLYYRLNVVPISTPPLRDRPGDVPELVHHFIKKVCENEEMPPKRISRETLDRLAAHDWPGNVRQLENAVEMAVALSGDRDMLFPGDFPLPGVLPRKAPAGAAEALVSVPDEGLDFEAVVGRIERHILEQALRITGGNKKQAADMLRLKRTTFAAKLKSLELAPVC